MKIKLSLPSHWGAQPTITPFYRAKWDISRPRGFCGLREDFYTEKTFDPFLARTIPIYAGATNIKDFLDVPDEWLIDLRDLSKSVERIERLLEAGNDESGQAALEANRSKVLGEAHFLERVVSMVSEVADGMAPKPLAFSGVAQKKSSKSSGLRALKALLARPS